MSDLSYADRMESLKNEVKREHKKFSSKKTIVTSERDKEFGSVLLRLMNTDDFKLYMKFEAEELSSLYASSFDPHSEMKGAEFGECMAFNKGRVHQLRHMINIRNNIVSRYVESMKLEVSDGKS